MGIWIATCGLLSELRPGLRAVTCACYKLAECFLCFSNCLLGLESIGRTIILISIVSSDSACVDRHISPKACLHHNGSPLACVVGVVARLCGYLYRPHYALLHYPCVCRESPKVEAVSVQTTSALQTAGHWPFKCRSVWEDMKAREFYHGLVRGEWAHNTRLRDQKYIEHFRLNYVEVQKIVEYPKL